jgi:hypothetical protein
MKNVVIQDGSIFVQLDYSKLRARQQAQLKKLIQDNQINLALAYLESFQGKFNRVYFSRLAKDGFDKLENRRKDHFLRLHRAGFDYEGSSFAADETIPEGQAIGIEIECFIPFEGECETRCDRCENDGDEVSDHDCSDYYYTVGQEHRSETIRRIKKVFEQHGVKRVKIKDDGSLREPEGAYSFEFTCLTRADNFDNLERLCKALKVLGASVNSSCGLHVHLDARDGAGRSIATRLKNSLPLLKKLVPKSRLNNSYCLDDVSTRGKRYAKINRESLRKHRTIEVRMHSGTTDFTKIKNWTLLLLQVARGPNRLKEAKASDTMGALAVLQLPLELNAWVLERIQKFQGETFDQLNGVEQAA